ncbi:MAG: TetR/AcrR family transcriptional regulator [Gammaproteobacteria bacterium]|nr:TetR/AcrR family transcriptional regulator [Gammaproteobacteria bacterium]MCY4356789.1 TetR/AcrR family transcriptional regulator [Gammaproteobacteria bacterium]
MARPIEFDEAKVLTNAMEQFWKEGFEASSIQKLLDCADINRGTLYNSFGDKETFFKSCVDHYNILIDGQIDDSLKNEALGPWESINRFFELSVLNTTARRRNMGCMLVNALCDSINHNRNLKRVIRSSLANIRKPLTERLKQAQQKGKLKKGVSVEFATEILMNFMHGVRVNSREGKSPDQLKDLISFTIGSLKK